MEQSLKDTGMLTALMLDLEETRLPRAMRLLDKVNGGQILSERDIRFLQKVSRDSNVNRSLVNRHPEYHSLLSRCFVLYTEIINKGLDNEKARLVPVAVPVTGARASWEAVPEAMKPHRQK